MQRNVGSALEKIDSQDAKIEQVKSSVEGLSN
jgi:hypothetical protein